MSVLFLYYTHNEREKNAPLKFWRKTNEEINLRHFDYCMFSVCWK